MMEAVLERPVGRPKKVGKIELGAVKTHASVLRDARIVVSVTGEPLADYVARLLAPQVAKDKAEVLKKEQDAARSKK